MVLSMNATHSSAASPSSPSSPSAASSVSVSSSPSLSTSALSPNHPEQQQHNSQRQETAMMKRKRNNSADNNNQYQRKKLKAPNASLNFSIESLIRPTTPPSPDLVVSAPADSDEDDNASDTMNLNNESNNTQTSATPSSASSCATWSKERNERGAGSTNQLLKQKICRDPRLAPFQCHLDNLELWHKFHPLDTEMIITKQGRRMFPPVRVTFSLADLLGSQAGANMGPTSTGSQQQLQFSTRDKYQVLMDILPYDSKRYRYAYHKSSWQQAGKADPPSPTKLFLHPDGPFTLDQLKRQVISFEKIKLTNNDANKHGYIVLNSMHKYQPRIHLVLWRGKDSQMLANAPISQLEQEIHKTFIFSETIFTAVTAYQNHSITKLKIDSNPFAKGFRDSSRLTDLELESMQDLMSEGQCPFSPPRAPPHGFPHFLFAAAAAQQHQQNSSPLVEDPASALLRERTIMALDSFLQHQQHQQHQQQHPQSVIISASPHRHTSQQQSLQHLQTTPPSPQSSANPNNNTTAQNNTNPSLPAISSGAHSPFGAQNSFGAFLGSVSQSGAAAGGGNSLSGAQLPPPAQQQHQHQTPTSGSNQASQNANLEQLLMQQQHQFAAAMAAAAAATGGHPLHSLFAMGNQAMMQSTHHQQSAQSQQLLHQQQHVLINKQTGSPGARSCQLSPIAASKQLVSAANLSLDGSSQQQFHGGPLGGALNQQHYHNAAAAAAGGGAPAPPAAPPPPPPAATAGFHPQHLQAVMAAAQHHQHQMALSALQLDQHHHLQQQQQQQQQQQHHHIQQQQQLAAAIAAGNLRHQQQQQMRPGARQHHLQLEQQQASNATAASSTKFERKDP